jgi:hypothetical protein
MSLFSDNHITIYLRYLQMTVRHCMAADLKKIKTAECNANAARRT